MDWKTFWITLAVGIGFVVVQGIFAASDHRFSSAQMNYFGVRKSWSFLQHGGMWADVFIISPVVAFVLSKYQLDHSSTWGISTLAGSAIFAFCMVLFYQEMGKAMGDHCTHEGRTTTAGWIHGVYAFMAIWVLLEVYLGLTAPVVSKLDILIITVWMTPFFYLGVKKFHHLWVMSQQDLVQVAALTIGIWFIALMRLVLT